MSTKELRLDDFTKSMSEQNLEKMQGKFVYISGRNRATEKIAKIDKVSKTTFHAGGLIWTQNGRHRGAGMYSIVDAKLITDMALAKAYFDRESHSEQEKRLFAQKVLRKMQESIRKLSVSDLSKIENIIDQK